MPVTVTFAPTYNVPVIPAPPTTTNAPVVVLVLVVAEAAIKLDPKVD